MIDLTLSALLKTDNVSGMSSAEDKTGNESEKKHYLPSRYAKEQHLFPFVKQQAVVVEQSDMTSQIEYDAKLFLKSTPQGRGIILILDKATYIGCMVSIFSLFDNDVVVNSVQKKIKKGAMMNLIYDGDSWQEIAPAISGPGRTRTLLKNVTQDMSLEIKPGWYEFVLVGGGGGGGCSSYVGGSSGYVKRYREYFEKSTDIQISIGKGGSRGNHGCPSSIEYDGIKLIAEGGGAGCPLNEYHGIACQGGALGGMEDKGQDYYSPGGERGKHGIGYGSGGGASSAGGAGGYGDYIHPELEEGAPGVVEIYMLD